MFTVRVVGDKQIVARLSSIPRKLKAALKRTLTRLALDVRTHIVADKLSGQVLNVRTGALRNSIAYKITDDGSAVYASVFSSGDVKYAGIHEFGGVTPPHEIMARNAEALAFMMGGKPVFAKRVQHPGSRIPERSFMRSSLADYADEIRDEMTETIRDAVELS